MRTDETRRGREAAAGGGWAPLLARLAIVVLVLGAVLLGAFWAVGGEDSVSDTWVGATVTVAFVAGLAASLVAAVVGLVDLVRNGSPPRSWLPMLTFPTVLLLLVLLELLVLE